jgi:hypothetical protein
MGPSRSAQASVTRGSFLPTREFERELSRHVGKDIDLGVGARGANLRAKLDAVLQGSVTYIPQGGQPLTIPIAKVFGFTAGEQYARHRKRV